MATRVLRCGSLLGPLLATLLLSSFALAQTKPPAPVPPKPAELAKPADPASKGVAPAKPVRLTLKDVLQMQKNRQTPDDILGFALEHGSDIEITKAIHSQLTKLGFSAQQIEGLTTAYKAEPLPPIVGGKHLATTEQERDTVFKQVQQIAQATLADPQYVQTKHFTLWAPKDLQALFVPDIQKIEALLETRFQEPVRSGLDKRSAHLILIKSPQECAAWVRKHYDVFQMKTDNPGGKEAYLKPYLEGFVYGNLSVTCLARQKPEAMRRWVAANIGYIYFEQLAAPVDPLATGFGNVVERALAGSPTVLISGLAYGQDERKFETDPRGWATLVKSRAAARTMSMPGKLLAYDTTNMTLAHYAEAWTLVDLLAQDRIRFGKLVEELAKSESTLKAIEAVYGWDEARLATEWLNHVTAN